MKHVAFSGIGAFLGGVAAYISTAVLPDIETSIGITNVSHYPQIIIGLAVIGSAISGAVLGYLLAED